MSKSVISILYLCLAWGVVLGAKAQEEPATDERPVILVLGDSLSAAYNMALAESWPRLLQSRLDSNGQRYRVQNASITGDTTQGGRARLPRLLNKYSPAILIIELGGNDGLRGLPLEVTRDNLTAMASAGQAAGARVLLVGVPLPPNYGPDYIRTFQALFGEVADAVGARLVPGFLDGVALVEGMMQEDGIHPSVAAQPVLLENLWSVLEPELIHP